MTQTVTGQTLYLAELDTRSFHFTALGTTEREAREAMRRTWQEHCRDYARSVLNPIAPWSEFADDVNVYPIPVGGGLRDGEQINPRPRNR